VCELVKSANKAMTVRMVKRSFKRLDVPVEDFILIQDIHSTSRGKLYSVMVTISGKRQNSFEKCTAKGNKIGSWLKNESYEQRLKILGLTSLE